MEVSRCRSPHLPGRRALPVLMLIVIVFLGACDPSTPSADRSATTPSPTRSSATTSSSTAAAASPSPRPTDASQLLYDARGALFVDSSGFHVSGTIPQVLVSVDFTYGPHKLASGTITQQGGGVLKVRQVADGTRYARGDSAWFADNDSGRDLSAIAGRWVVVPRHNPPLALLLADLADPGYLYNGVVPPDIDGTIVGPKAVNGIDAYVITDGADTYAFAALGPPRPIAFNRENGGGEQRVRFDRYDAPISVKAPPPSEVVALPRPS